MTKANHHEKYDSQNPIAQILVNGFMSGLESLSKYIDSEVNNITECGCGQGHVNQLFEKLYPNAKVKGIDINLEDLAIANNYKIRENTDIYHKSIYDIGDTEKADLVVCCEVLEHLENPELALKKMIELKAKYYIFSVPNEPLWRILNFMRGKYLKNWGNTPDHINHWSTKSFKDFIGSELNIVKIKKPIPWSMIIAKQPE